MTRFTLTLAFDAANPDDAQLVAAAVYNAAAALPEAGNVWLLDRPAPLVVVDGETRAVSGLLRPDAVASLAGAAPAGSRPGTPPIPALPAVPAAPDWIDATPALVPPLFYRRSLNGGRTWGASLRTSPEPADAIAAGRRIAIDTRTTVRVEDSNGTVAARFLPTGERVEVAR